MAIKDNSSHSEHHVKTEILKICPSNPACVHGPTILFGDKDNKNYFACSAYRDRKSCHFYHPQDENISEKSASKWAEIKKTWTDQQMEQIRNAWAKKLEISKLETSRRAFCQGCHTFFDGSMEKDKHVNHVHELGLRDNDLDLATKLLQQKNANKKEAQYHFSEETVDVFISNIQKNGFRNVICIGTPRLFEVLRRDSSIKVVLLDIDTRLANFFKPGHEWLWYNMFNHHFFNEKHEKRFENFVKLATENLLVITDPPFGGRTELLAETWKKISQNWKNIHEKSEDPTLMWIFPYFMETKIQQELSDLKMSDFQVEYSNHVDFSGQSTGRKQGSPVRVFTNLKLMKFDLSKSSSYKYCDKCQIWVANSNKHCDFCNSCTAKNGGSYKHCRKCKRCVKISWNHCKKCKRCALPKHPCAMFRKMKKNNLNNE